MLKRIRPELYVRPDGTMERHPIWLDGEQLEPEGVTRLPPVRVGGKGTIIVTFKARTEGAPAHHYTRFNIEVPPGRGLTRFDITYKYTTESRKKRAA